MFPEKAILGGHKMVRYKPRKRRGFGRIEQRPSGRYRAAYTGPDGQLYRAPMTFERRTTPSPGCRLGGPRSRWRSGPPTSPPAAPATVGADLRRLRRPRGSRRRKTKGRELRPTTRHHYQLLLDNYIYPTFGDERIDQITVEDVNDWYDALAPGRETMRAQAYSLLRTILDDGRLDAARSR